MPDEHIKVIMGPDEVYQIRQEIGALQELALSLQAVGIQLSSAKVMLSCRKISNVLDENSWDVGSTEFQDPSM